MLDKPFDPATAIYTPSEVATYGLQAVQATQAKQHRGVGLGLGIDDYFAPVLPGQVCAIIGQTSNYKSGFMHFIEHQAAQQIAESGDKTACIVHVSVEECVEEQAFLEFARYGGESVANMVRGQVQDWTKLLSASATVAGVPIFRIGDSIARAEDMPHLTMSNMIRSIRHLRDSLLDWRPRIVALFFDYLQAFPYDEEHQKVSRSDQRRLQVRADMYRLRQAAAYFDCPVFVGVQAKQHLTGAQPPIYLPGVYDGEESSSIAQRCDRVITMWMPKTTSPLGTQVTGAGMNFMVQDDDLFIKIAKQRGGLPAGRVYHCRVQYGTNIISRRMP